MNISELHDIFDQQNAWKTGLVFTGTCCDCNQTVQILVDALEDGFHVEGGAIYTLQSGKRAMKCDPCYQENPEYNQDAEVYSRVVGYLRPVKNWHSGKQAEFGMRRTFDRTVAV